MFRPPPTPPLHPSGDEGRRLLRAELLHAEYHRQNLFQRILDWLSRRLDSGIGAASGSSWVTTLVTMTLVALLVVGLVWVLSRFRRDRRRRAAAEAMLPEHHESAAELRRRAEAALREGRHDAALVDAFRAVAARQVERGRIDDQPGATVHEVAARLAATYPTHGSSVGRTADLFDATMYGHHAASHEDAADAIALDDALAGAR
jgi:Domain of unknown function (DUF4129)